MLAEVLGLDLDQWLAVAVAGGTLAMAVSTQRMAKAARDQGEEMAKLVAANEKAAAIADRHLAATGEPFLTLERDLIYDVGGYDPVQLFTVQVNNIGAIPARLVECMLHIGSGTLQPTPGSPTIVAPTDSPATLSFDAEGWVIPDPITGVFIAVYDGAGSGIRRQLRAEIMGRREGRISIRNSQTTPVG